ncbi:unnamed protein product [Brachionus calyciflorus]|uniref:GPI ethanolamine phosphate transferase 1 n=1 Tax=Brachionus calyciflorus TaxID=104777 RepID=A0A813MZP5_9BILA|nr:unnamed protein product [Brachionus calyciflorus]
MEPIPKLIEKNPAKRLVLFVADGLRYDSFFNLIEENESMFLSQKRKKGATFAISNTQVPTESRPGHVAMIAGFYEDISAIAKGWKENPVEFDSVFNRSRYTWAWGSPDILNLFKKSTNNVFLKMYDSSIEDFASENATILDQWVLHHFKKFIYHSKANLTETKMLKEENIVFFFHLLGIDTHGHSKKPHSNEYQSNILYVDNLVKEVNEIFDEYYSDNNETAFVFTADHGMTDWGSHGSGDDSERLTPFVGWGAGFDLHQEYERNNLMNIQQISIAPLMSFLIGVPIPINSVGKLPLGVLSSDKKTKSLAYLQNSLQIIEQLKIKHHHCKNSAIFFQEFKDLKISDTSKIIQKIENFIQHGNYEEAISETDRLIELSLKALDYYHKYNKFYLGLCIIFSCTGWIIFLLNHNLKSIVPTSLNLNRSIKASSINKIFTVFTLLTILAALYQNFPVTYYFYTLLPLFLWRSIFIDYKFLSFLMSIWSEKKIQNSVYSILLIIGIECMVLSFFYRWIFSILLVLYSIFLMIKLKIRQDQLVTKTIIVLSSILLAVYPLLPVIKGYTHLYLVYLASIVSNMMFFFIMNKMEILKNSKASYTMMVFNIFSLVNIFWIRQSIESNSGLPFLGQIFSYLTLLSCLFLPIVTELNLKKRLIYILFSFFNSYFHLSISYESLFLLFLGLQMISWLLIESFLYSGEFNIDFALSKKRSSYFVESYDEDDNESMNWSNLFRVYLLVFYLLLAFFGTGNMASINSFDPVSVYCFITVFSPFLMGFLLFLKITIPFLIVIAIFYCVYDVIHLSIRISYIFLMIMSDLMALRFFFLIRTEGSWLDIGTSISHYIIVMLKIIIVSVLFSVAQFLFKYEIGHINLFRSIKKRIIKDD